MKLRNIKIGWGALVIATYIDLLIALSPFMVMLLIAAPAVIYQWVFIAKAIKRRNTKTKVNNK